MLTEWVRLDRHAGEDGVEEESSIRRSIGVDGSGDEDGEVAEVKVVFRATHLCEGDRRSKSGVRRLGMMAGERLDPGRSARSCVAEYRIKEVGVAGEERNGLRRTPPPSLERDEMLDADDDERRDLDDDDDDDGEEKPRRQDSMKAKESSRSWNWS